MHLATETNTYLRYEVNQKGWIKSGMLPLFNYLTIIVSIELMVVFLKRTTNANMLECMHDEL